MKKMLFCYFGLVSLVACSKQPSDTVSTNTTRPMATKYNSLSPSEAKVLLEKATDRPFTGDYYNKKTQGLYVCRQCNNPLYRSEDKFDSHCGWPSFDDEIDGAVVRVPDADGFRTEIICANCKGHLGHVFLNEGFTDKETRHCVNTSSLQFYSVEDKVKIPAVIR